MRSVKSNHAYVSHFTPGAEIVAADLGIRTEGLPALQLWDMVLQRLVRFLLQEDNQAFIQIFTTEESYFEASEPYS